MQKRNTQLTMKDIDARMVFGILVGVAAIIIAFPFLIVWALIMNTATNSRSNNPRNDEPRNDEVAIEDARALMDETLFLHNHYKMDGTVVQRLKDPEW